MEAAADPAVHPGAITRKLADGSALVVSRYGGQVLSWSDAAGREMLYLSAASSGVDGKPIRGGMPVCFPQFAARGTLPKHGFARTAVWTQPEQPAASPNRVHLQLREQVQTLAVWPHRFLLDLRVEFSGKHLHVTLQVKNTDVHAWNFTAALHTYFRVDEVTEAALHGLRGVAYQDALDGGRRVEAAESMIQLNHAIDRVYLATPRSVSLDERDRRLEIVQRGFADTVVWNPGPGAAAILGDMPAGDERRMLCIEAGQVGNPISLKPGDSWLGSQETHLR